MKEVQYGYEISDYFGVSVEGMGAGDGNRKWCERKVEWLNQYQPERQARLVMREVTYGEWEDG